MTLNSPGLPGNVVDDKYSNGNGKTPRFVLTRFRKPTGAILPYAEARRTQELPIGVEGTVLLTQVT